MSASIQLRMLNPWIGPLLFIQLFIFPITQPVMALGKPLPSKCGTLLQATELQASGQSIQLRDKLIEEYHLLQASYTPEKAKKFKDKLERYFKAAGTLLENFNLEDFVHDRLMKISQMKAIPSNSMNRLKLTLQKYFVSKRLPSLKVFKAQFSVEELKSLPVIPIYLSLEDAFKVWDAKIVFDEHGTAAFNRLTENLKTKEGLAEVSLNLDLMLKNEWLAFFEGEKGAGQFNPSVEAALNDRFGPIEDHESTHMVLQILASQGKLSPMHVKMTLDKKFLKTGAVGEIQKQHLGQAIAVGSTEDFYRSEFYLEELATHIVEGAMPSGAVSKLLNQALKKYLEEAGASDGVREEVWSLYAEYLRSEGGIFKASGTVSPHAFALFDRFLTFRPGDLGRTGITVKVKEQLELFRSLQTLTDEAVEGLLRAQSVIQSTLESGGKLKANRELFLGKKGYIVPVRIPVDVYQEAGVWKTVEGMTVSFRFTQTGPFSDHLGPVKEGWLNEQIEWGLRFARKIQSTQANYARWVEQGSRVQFSVKEILSLQEDQMRLREEVRELIREIKERPERF